MVAMDDWDVDELFARGPARGAVRRAEPRRVRGRARHAVGPLSVRRVRRAAAAPHLGSRRRTRSTAREGAKRVAIINGGTIPDRGLYGVFLVGERGPARARRRARRRDGVREPRRRDVPARRLDRGASRRSRTTACSSRRRRASRARCRSGRRTRRAGRSSSGAHRRADARRCAQLPPAAAIERLIAAPRSRSARGREPAAVPRRSGRRRRRRARRPHDRRSSAAATSSATGASACSRRSAAASTRRGRWRSSARSARRPGIDVETMWTDDGFVVRFPETDEPPDPRLLLPASGRGRGARRAAARRHGAVRGEVPRGRGARAAAAEAPARRRAARCGSSASAPPICWRVAVALRIVPDAARDLPRVPARRLRHAGARRDAAPDRAPRDPRRDRRLDDAVAVRGVAALQLRRQLHLRRRRAAGRAPRAGARRSIRRSCASCSAKRSCASCSTPTRSREVERQLQQLDPTTTRASGRRRPRPAAAARRPDARRDRRRAAASTPARRARRARARRAARSPSASAASRAAFPVEDAAAIATRSACRCRSGCPSRCSQPVPQRGAGSRAALRAHARAVHHRSSSPRATALGRAHGGSAAEGARGGRPAARGRVPAGRTRPRVERPGRAAVDPPALARASCASRSSRSIRRCSAGCSRAGRASSGRRAGLDALLDAIENLQGAPLPASILETRDPRRARRAATTRPISTRSTAAGEVVWCGVEPLGERDGRLALYLTDHLAAPAARRPRSPSCRRARAAILDASARRRARRSSPRCTRRRGGGYPGETVDALWDLVWRGLLTNDTFHALRAFTRPPERRAAQAGDRPQLSAAAASAPPSAEGRWSLVERSRRRAACRRRNGRRRRRSSCSRATAC